MSFDPFGDFDTRGYLRNAFADKAPEIVKLKEHNAFRMHVGEALDALAARRSLKYQNVLDTHRRLFSDYYPWAGQDRAAVLPDLAVGKAGRYDLFSHPQDSQRAVEYGLSLARDKVTMRENPGEIMGLPGTVRARRRKTPRPNNRDAGEKSRSRSNNLTSTWYKRGTGSLPTKLKSLTIIDADNHFGPPRHGRRRPDECVLGKSAPHPPNRSRFPPAPRYRAGFRAPGERPRGLFCLVGVLPARTGSALSPFYPSSGSSCECCSGQPVKML
jgi:hypothetical protein